MQVVLLFHSNRCEGDSQQECDRALHCNNVCDVMCVVCERACLGDSAKVCARSLRREDEEEDYAH